MPYHLLIVDGDTESNGRLAQGLRQEFDVDSCELARQALDRLRARKPDLLMLGLDLPDMDGMTFLKVLRETEQGKEIPAIVMSLKKTEESVMQAYELGIDDYMSKPVDVRELLVRSRTVLRRRFERAEHWGAALSVQGIEIDPSQRRCLVHGKRVVLRPREFELLEILMRKAGRVLSRNYLLETIWGMSSSSDTRAVDVMVSRLRRKLGARGRKNIETVSKMGYTFLTPTD